MNANTQNALTSLIPYRVRTSPQKLSSSFHSGLRFRLTDCPRHEAHLPRRYPAPPPLRIVTVTLAPTVAFCAVVVLPPPPPPIPVPYHAGAIRVTPRMLWLVAISLPPPTMEDCSPTNRKLGASQIQLIHLFRKWYCWNNCCWRVKVHSWCNGRPLLLL